MVVQISQKYSLAGLFKAFQHRKKHWVKKQFSLRESGLLGLSQTRAAVSVSFGKRVSLLSSAAKQPRGSDVWGGGDEHGICENSDELLQAFQKSAQHYPEPQLMSPQQEKPWSAGGCSLSHRNPISSFSQEPML